jgi:hypothetical protein
MFVTNYYKVSIKLPHGKMKLRTFSLTVRVYRLCGLCKLAMSSSIFNEFCIRVFFSGGSILCRHVNI